MLQLLSRASIAIGLTLFVLFNANAQTTNIRMAVINSTSFQDVNKGVTKLIAIEKKLDIEFKPLINEMTGLQKKLEAFEKTISSWDADYNKKREEYDKVLREYERKRENYSLQYQKRYNELATPLHVQMESALTEWCKKQGYNMLIDISKDDKGVYLWVEESFINKTTDDLIKHFNAVL